MPKIAKELSSVAIRNISKKGLHAVGGVSGLAIKVAKGQSKSWVLKTMVGAKRREIGLGGFPDVSIAEARDKARLFKAKIREGIDPAEERRKNKEGLIREQRAQITFTIAWVEYWKKKSVELNERTCPNWTNTLNNYAIPVLGNMIVRDIQTDHILAVLKPIWHTKTPTAKKLRGRLEAVLSWATAMGYRQGDNPARWKDNLKELLPSPNKIHKVEHRRAMPLDELPDFMSLLREKPGNDARAMEFLILTAARVEEALGAQWQEIDLGKKLWEVPEARMKESSSHMVTLPDAAISILKDIPQRNGLIFLSATGLKMSDVTLSKLLKALGVFKKQTSHGFRSLLKGWADENDHAHFVSEMALAHSVGDDVQQAYRRSELLSKRFILMNQWANFLGYPKTPTNVVPIEAKV
jgi:integrase